ncbi:GNAT family N-acetyltransferase [Nocardia amamiensis]|uniref:GNAT family N-acetyltransferase n=1 Tax=Nocardia amamiensis TaxID=404578 RepID=UPI00082CF0FD|nr:GNAT family N-acetyltransferase [Nocardia amamiensis]
MSQDIRLTDGIVRLRPVTVADAMTHLAGEDDEFARWYSGGHSTPESVADYFTRCVHEWETDAPGKTFAIEHLDAGTMIGTIDLDTKRPYREKRQASLAYGIYAEFRGRGAAGRAVSLACVYLASQQLADQAVIRVHPDNRASAAVARHCGFIYSHQTTEDDGPLDWYVKTLAFPRSGDM